MQDTSKTKEEIIKFLQENGPNLPIKISQHIKTNSLFTSAFLSELLNDQRLKITNMKVGSSPVYFVSGTEAGLEKFSEHLKSKEKEAFNMLKENSFLEDETQHPAIRVALRSIPDFAKAFKYKDKIIWRYFLNPAQEYVNKNSEKKGTQEDKTEQKNNKEEKKEQEKQTENKEKTKLPETFVSSIKENFEKNDEEEDEEEVKQEKIEEKEKAQNKNTEEKKKTQPEQEIKTIEKNRVTKNETTFNNPLAHTPKTDKKEKPKSEFCKKIIEIIQKNNWDIIEELEFKAKEYNALIQINSDLGPIIFKLQAKDKKTFTEKDLSKLLGEAQAIPLPALYMTNGEAKKKTQEFLNKYNSIIKYKKIE